MNNKKYCLAMFDIRGKQKFIFRTNKLKEIVGASWLIRDLFDEYLFEAAEKVSITVNGQNESSGIFSFRNGKADSDFTWKGFEEHLKEGYIGEVIYDGGGNFQVLFSNKTVFQETTFQFTKTIMEEIGTLSVLATAIEIDANADNYKSDVKKLYAEHRKMEAVESNIAPWSCLPVVQVDRQTSQPLVYDKDWISNNRSGNEQTNKYSREALAKRKKFEREMARIEGQETKRYGRELSEGEKTFYKQYKENEKILDYIVDEKGEDSKLAIIYTDGNGMGAKVVSKIKDVSCYQCCTKKLREFSDHIEETYVQKGITAALQGIEAKNYRIIVAAGDEINIIVKAQDAFRCAKTYLDKLKSISGESACAGIAIFHSHAPYADAYRIAEEACESGKKVMQKKGMTSAAFLDFQVLQGAIGTSLKHIREKETPDLISRPWLMWSDNDTEKDVEDIQLYKEIDKTVKILQTFSRTNIKGLAAAAYKGTVTLSTELDRMYAHLSNDKKDKLENDWKWLKAMDAEKQRRILYDISLVYDFWFNEEQEEPDEENGGESNE